MGKDLKIAGRIVTWKVHNSEETLGSIKAAEIKSLECNLNCENKKFNKRSNKTVDRVLLQA